MSDQTLSEAYVTDLYQPLMDLADVVVTRGSTQSEPWP